MSHCHGCRISRFAVSGGESIGSKTWRACPVDSEKVVGRTERDPRGATAIKHCGDSIQQVPLRLISSCRLYISIAAPPRLPEREGADAGDLPVNDGAELIQLRPRGLLASGARRELVAPAGPAWLCDLYI